MALHVRRLGSGPPLFLLHGIGMMGAWWAPCLDALAIRHEVHVVDLPGHGESDRLPPDEPPTPERLTDAVAGLGLEGAHAAGISLGGWIAVELARRGIVRTATAFSPAGLWEGWERGYVDRTLASIDAILDRLAGQARLLTATAAGRTASFGIVCGRPWLVPAADGAQFIRGIAAADFDRTRRAMMPATLAPGPDAPVPVTVAWGTRDRLLFPRQAARAIARVPGARRLDLPGCGHIPTYDDPQVTVEAILSTTGA